MAELGLAANLAGVISAGLALSKLLYDFASVIGSASRDIKGLATDISLFCSVLKQVQTTLARAKAYRLSMSALQTAGDIIDRCQLIFTDLQATLDKLRNGDAKLDLLSRMKWFFQEKRVRLVHEQLNTCSATLHLMLTTMMLAQKIASKRLSLEPENDQDSQDRLMTHTLLMTQQAANERLAAVEDELILEDVRRQADLSLSLDPLAVPNTDNHSESQRLRHRRNRSSQMIYGAVHNPFATSSSSFDKHKRLSVVLSDHINRLSLLTQLSTVDENRFSVLQTDELLRHWTDQSDPLAVRDGDSDDLSEETYPLCEDGQSSLNPAAFVIEPLHREISHSDTDELLNTGSPNKSSLFTGQSVTAPNVIEETTKPVIPNLNYPVLGSFRVASDDPCRKVLPVALHKYGLGAENWPKYSLYIVYGNLERLIGLEEKPLELFRDFDRRGKKPMFMLRKVENSVPQSLPPYGGSL